jgi:phenol 2-monooxygenase
MQFHLNGFRTGDPEVAEAAVSAKAGEFPASVDVLIVGCGPAGLTLAAQLSAFPDIVTRIVEQKPGPLELGQADGIACRTMEMFEAFGFSERVMKEGYWVNETSFWRPDPADSTKIVRYDRVQDVEDGLSEFPHMILNQARVHDFYLQVMRNSARRLEPDYGKRFIGLESDETQPYPVKVTLQRGDADSEASEIVRAKYVVGCDGARSAVRQALGRALHGDSANQAWGVMDVLAVTDFPDIRLKVLIQSAGEGSIVLIPREGGYLVRIYVELDKLNENERLAGKSITVDRLIAATRRILNPYRFDVKEVGWWSVYEIGQRLCEKFDDVPEAEIATRAPRVFIAGDACHTHSPKAGQGMNVSMQDGYNLGWKLAHVLRGQCAPEFLHSYSAERHAVAKELIDFDREWAKMISAPLKNPGVPESEGVDPEAVRAYFVKHGRYTAGTATRYAPSVLTGKGSFQSLAKGFAIGMRFHSAPVVRLADAKEMSLGHCSKADGRWRIYAFADSGDPASPSSRIRALCEFLSVSEESPVRRYTGAGQDIDAVIDLRAVFQQSHRNLRVETLPAFLLPEKGRLGLRDYEKMFCADPRDGRDIFDLREIDRGRGCMVVVRPDQYVADILPLDDYKRLSSYFSGFMQRA